MLQALVNEQERLVKNAIAQFIGIIGKHEFPDNTWPEILQFVHTLTSSDTIFDKEVNILKFYKTFLVFFFLIIDLLNCVLKIFWRLAMTFVEIGELFIVA